MRIAFARWGDRIAPVFDTARHIHVIDIESGQIISETKEPLADDLVVQRALRLVELGIGTLICGAISRQMQGLITAYGIQVVPFVAGNLREVIQAWLSGPLSRDVFAMPGCRGRERRGFRNKQELYQEGIPMKPRGQGRRGAGGGQGRGQGQGQGRGQGGQRPGRTGGAAGQGVCVCPECGHQLPHERGVPCLERQCPKCGNALIRQ